MKIKYLFLAMAAALMAGCSDDLDRGGAYNPEKGVTATIPTYPFDDGTRVNISDDLQTFTWSDGDELGIYYADTGLSADARFKILQGGSSTGNFSNDVFYLNNNRTYYSFYPYQPYGEINAVPVDYTGQIQNGNGSAAHLGAYNYMYGTVNINSNGSAFIAYKNLGSVMQLRLTVSNSATYTGIDITSDGAEFITKGTASMIDGSITATETSASIHLDFENGIALNAGDVLTTNILTAPVDMSGSILTITLITADNDEFEVTTEGKNMLQGKAYLYEETVPYVQEIPYVTFTADAEQTLRFGTYNFYYDNDEETPAESDFASFEYSINGQSWRNISSFTTLTFGGEKGVLRIRGKNLNGTSNFRATDDYIFTQIEFGNTNPVACSGDIRTLIDFENYTTVLTENARFVNLFRGCYQLTSAPELPATTLAEGCYYSMFSGCTSLTQTPELPATTLARSCYGEMFRGCTSLIKAPKLQATTLTNWCYYSMFSGCTSLTQAPELQATNLAFGCYRSMFQGCTSLTQAPELPATNLESSCYDYMFWGCTSLTQAPELPATNLASNCYRSMFQGCTSLTQAPELPATTLARSCYGEMFRECTSLTQAPELLATNLTDYCYWYMFFGCSNLNYIKMMATNISAFECLNYWVNGVSSTGIFVKNKDASWDIIANCGIPSGWTVETASE